MTAACGSFKNSTSSAGSGARGKAPVYGHPSGFLSGSQRNKTATPEVEVVMRSRMASTSRATAAFAAVLLFAACGQRAPDPQVGAGRETTTTPAPSVEPTAPPELDKPPPVTVRFFDDSVALQAWTYCLRDLCVDGGPPAEPSDLGDPEAVIVEFPLRGWSFTAEFRPAGNECGRVQQVPLEAAGDGRFVLRPAGFAGSYDVTLFGRGDGDLFVTFRWTTPVDGPLPTPEARVAVLAHNSRRPYSYGVELEVANLARSPRQASARITVEAADGDTLTFNAERSGTRCLPEGTVYWDGPDEKGLAAAALGKGPFTYTVELVLDGARYAAAAVWPADEIVGSEPSVALHFTPTLPGVS
jgi:hypothetical protein